MATAGTSTSASAPMTTYPEQGTHVLGADGAGRLGWVGVIVDRRGYVAAAVDRSLAGLVRQADAVAADGGGRVAVVGVDMPIGLVAAPRRGADEAARAFVGIRRASVFWAPHRSVLDRGALDLDLADHAAVNAHLAALAMPRLSAQAWRLVPRIREVTELAAGDPRLIEVFPEATFRQLAGADLPDAKRCAAGALHRLSLLADADPPIALPGDPTVLGPAGAVALDDLFDAGAAAWSAWRAATGAAFALEKPGGEHDPVTGHRIAVWV